MARIDVWGVPLGVSVLAVGGVCAGDGSWHQMNLKVPGI